MRLDALPMPLEWLNSPVASDVASDGALTITAAGRTDHFVDPSDGTSTGSAPLLLAAVEGDFQLSARVAADLRATFDAGTLFLFGAGDTWAKLAVELSPAGTPTVVSVVTRGLSDDCNHWPARADGTWLRVSRTGTAYALHASADGHRWELVRHFALSGPVRVGFGSQSPTGDGCTATFSDVRFCAEGITDLRDGS